MTAREDQQLPGEQYKWRKNLRRPIAAAVLPMSEQAVRVTEESR